MSTKLRHRWANFEPRVDCLGMTKDTPMISSIFYNWDREGIYLLSFGSADKNVEDWCGHPHNPEGIELDHSEMESIASLFLGPSFPVLVTHKKWREDIGYFSYGLEVYHMESYEKEKGRCYKLINNEYVVAQFQNTFDGWSFERGDPATKIAY